MEAHENKQLALLKAIKSHELAAAGLADLMIGGSDVLYQVMLERIKQNVSELHAQIENSSPEEHL